MCTPRLPVVDWTDAPTNLNGLVCFAERRNLVCVCVPSHFNWSLHARPPSSQQWHLSICPCVARKLAALCRRNLCQVFVAMRWESASHTSLLQIIFQPDASYGVQRDGNTGLILPAGHVTSRSVTAGSSWSPLSTVIVQHPMISISVAPWRSTQMPNNLQHMSPWICRSQATDT